MTLWGQHRCQEKRVRQKEHSEVQTQRKKLVQTIKRRGLHFKTQQSKASNTKPQTGLKEKAGTIVEIEQDSLTPSKDRLLSCFPSYHLCVTFIPRGTSGQRQSQLSHFDARAIQRRRNKASQPAPLPSAMAPTGLLSQLRGHS